MSLQYMFERWSSAGGIFKHNEENVKNVKKMRAKKEDDFGEDFWDTIDVQLLDISTSDQIQSDLNTSPTLFISQDEEREDLDLTISNKNLKMLCVQHSSPSYTSELDCFFDTTDYSLPFPQQPFAQSQFTDMTDDIYNYEAPQYQGQYEPETQDATSMDIEQPNKYYINEDYTFAPFNNQDQFCMQQNYMSLEDASTSRIQNHGTQFGASELANSPTLPEIIVDDEMVQSGKFKLIYTPYCVNLFGRNGAPILYGLSLAIKHNIGVEPLEEENLYKVVNHDLFMFALHVFTSEKEKNSVSNYHRYKAMRRWVEIHDNRKRNRPWTFSIRSEKIKSWQKAYLICEQTLSVVENEPVLGFTCGIGQTMFDYPLSLDSPLFKQVLTAFAADH